MNYEASVLELENFSVLVLSVQESYTNKIGHKKMGYFSGEILEFIT